MVAGVRFCILASVTGQDATLRMGVGMDDSRHCHGRSSRIDGLYRRRVWLRVSLRKRRHPTKLRHWPSTKRTPKAAGRQTPSCRHPGKLTSCWHERLVSDWLLSFCYDLRAPDFRCRKGMGLRRCVVGHDFGHSDHDNLLVTASIKAARLVASQCPLATKPRHSRAQSKAVGPKPASCGHLLNVRSILGEGAPQNLHSICSCARNSNGWLWRGVGSQ